MVMAVPLAAPLSTILSNLDGYQVVEQQVSAEERKVAGMSNYVARIYSRDSAVAFTTYVGYYDRQTQGRTIHSPRNCLPGAGWEVLTAGTKVVNVNGANYVLNHNALKNGRATALVYYWYQGRGRLVANEYLVKWNLLRDAAVAGHTEEALVRIVVPVNVAAAPADSGTVARAYASADALGESIAVRLIGDVGRVLPRFAAPTDRKLSQLQ